MASLFLLTTLLSTFFPLALTTCSPQKSPDWTGWGGNPHNNRWASSNRHISSRSIPSLTLHCRQSYTSGVSATPVTSGDVVYYPTWDGWFVALKYVACEEKWRVNVSAVVEAYGGMTELQRAVTTPVSRTSPQVDKEAGVVYFGTLMGAFLVAVRMEDGTVLDAIAVNGHELAVITGSPTLYGGLIFAGASSSEGSAKGKVPGYRCCSFVGNLVAARFDLATEKLSIQWDVPMLPGGGETGWSGAAVWGSQPAIDEVRGQVLIGTGNLYTNPSEYDSCATNNPPIADCYPPEVLQESVLALDMATGKINWANRIPPGNDVDFGMMPAFVPGDMSSSSPSRKKDVVVVGQKSGLLYSIDATNGTINWATVTGPSGPAAGLSWGVAVDERRTYFTVINSGKVTWQMQPSRENISYSGYGAASLETGELLWETAAPHNSIAFGPPTIVGDVVLVARTGIIGPDAPDPDYDKTKGGLVALRKRTGEVIGDFELDANFHGGVAVKDKYAMFGTGYSNFNGTGSLYVMKVAKRV